MKSPQPSRFRIVTRNDGQQRRSNSPRTPPSPSVEHLRGDASTWSPNISPTFRRHHDPEEDHTPPKKSVLSKVKERARKLRYSLSGKKKHIEGENLTPSWGVTLEDVEDEEEDAEYLGAPMYESELAPEDYKENARLHPRFIPLISEKHVFLSSIKENEKPSAPSNTENGQENEKPPNQSKALTETVIGKPDSPNKTLAETVTEKLAPAYATVSDATHAITSMIQGLAVSTLSAPETKNHTTQESNKQDNLETFKQALPSIDTKTNPDAEKQETETGKIWNKGVSVKEYIMDKLEPGEEERALSKAITDVMSPKNKSPREGRVVGKMKEAVTSFLWHEESSQSSMTQPPTNASTSIPVSTNADDVFEEANEGRVLQTN